MTRRLKSIDVLRGLAACAVVLRHSDDRFLFGSIGVDFFFVISGFVMAQLYRDRSASQFMFDRAWRIFPIYWVALLPWFFVRPDVTVDGSIASLLLVPNWFGMYGTYLGVAWTLLFELLFYAGVALAIRLGSFLVPILIFAAALVARPYVGQPMLHFAGSPMIFEFLFGVAIACVPLRRLAGLVLMAAGALWLILYPNSALEDYRVAMSYGPAVGRVLLWGVPAAAIVYGMLTVESAFNGWLVDKLLIVGAASYSIYLVHTLVTKNVTLWWPAEFVLAVTAGIALWWAVERPILARKPKWFVKRRAVPGPASEVPATAG
jgi:exopolysaccharide production protein ExoZ